MQSYKIMQGRTKRVLNSCSYLYPKYW